MIEEIMNEKGRYTTLSDRLGSGFFGLILLFATGILVYHWPTSPEEAVARTIAALLIACPCAFAVAVPLTMATCSAWGIKLGVILKSQRAIEILSHTKTVFFDKTGTLTAGNPTVAAFRFDEGELQKINLSAEFVTQTLRYFGKYSSHHAVSALVAWAEDQSVPHSHAPVVTRSEEVIGKGMTIDAYGHHWRLGRADFCSPDLPVDKDHQLHLTIDGLLVALFVVEDRLNEDAAMTINLLERKGIQSGIVSGDLTFRTKQQAEELGIRPDLVFAEQTPAQKVERITNGFGPQGGTTVMVGNGFNDSLALIHADVGIAVAGASQQAKDAAEINLLNPGTLSVVTAIDLTMTARKKVATAFGFAATFNVIGLWLAALGHMHPVVAAVLMPISSITVITISMRWPKHAVSVR